MDNNQEPPEKIMYDLIQAGLQEWNNFVKDKLYLAMERKSIAWDDLQFNYDTTGTTTAVYNGVKILAWQSPVIIVDENKMSYTYQFKIYKVNS